METFLNQLPIVLNSLNVGFIQTLRLFFITLLGAIPLGLVIAFGSMSRFKPLSAFTRVIVWIIRGSPLMIQLLIYPTNTLEEKSLVLFFFTGIFIKAKNRLSSILRIVSSSFPLRIISISLSQIIAILFSSILLSWKSSKL